MARLAVAATLALTMIGARPMDDDLMPDASQTSTVESPTFVLGFADLKKQLGELMGEPVEPEHWTPNGDTVQLTTRGLAAWHAGDAPKFHDGSTTFRLEPRSQPAVASRLERQASCIIQRESQGYAGAVNPRSGASGLGQFLGSTWKTTPQGKAGLSVFDPAANRAAVVWMLSVGRGREFATLGGC